MECIEKKFVLVIMSVLIARLVSEKKTKKILKNNLGFDKLFRDLCI
jgi:hypothetical protein